MAAIPPAGRVRVGRLQDPAQTLTTSLDDAGLTARQIAARAWGTPIQVISRLVEHSSIAVTKLVHRKARSTRQPSGAIATDWTSP
ncbi:hypothetical protein AB0F15_10715 [Amycolatopsis sp. NPDC026612]|uniref:hypothetical protein n=1 Tax=Amycolatopsis sp. NPDC026612 TaxID=3155466 RepID=UPI0033F31D97